jgi:two-component system NarL family sensor kinase
MADTNHLAFRGADDAAWVEMLARVSGNLRLLEEAVTKRGGEETSRVSSGRRLVLGELERERSRIARELHAGAGQPLAALNLNLDLLDQWSAALPEQGRETVSRLRNLSASAMEQIRAVSHRLHPPEWQELTTEQALRSLIAQSGVAERFETRVDIAPLPDEPGHGAKVAVYRCAQECIANVIRHSQATRVEIALAPAGDRIVLRVSDNGKGIDSKKSGGGIGLKAIQEHIELMGGQCELVSGTTGTTITVSFPLAED